MSPDLPREHAPTGLRTARHWWVRHPRIMLALRTALAAAIAWYVAHLVPGPGSEYPYYAPMGAVVATSSSIRGTTVGSLQAVLAIIAGGLIGVGAGAVGEDTSPVVIAVAVTVAVLAGGHRMFGQMGSWVATVALFTLVIGYGQTDYVAAYAGMVLLGAAIGVVITLLLPQLPLAPAIDAIARVRDELAEQLQLLAKGLRAERPPDPEQWQELSRSLEPHRAAMRSEISGVTDSLRGNRLARHHATEVDILERQAKAFDRTTTMVQDLVQLIPETQQADAQVLSFGPAVRGPAACVLDALADLLDEPEAHDPSESYLVDRAENAVDRLVDAIDRGRDPDLPGGGVLVASNMVMTARRCISAVSFAVADRDISVTGAGGAPPDTGPSIDRNVRD